MPKQQSDLLGSGGINLMKKDKILKILDQTGKIKSLPRDKGRPGKFPGKRVSAKGNLYWETRKNRSDAPLSKT